MLGHETAIQLLLERLDSDLTNFITLNEISLVFEFK